ncbi:hypothetical protein Enr13x_30840 [Stieleria neptunia]|uniref:Uncharacterized protein n=2 Tax=Stieleria neptunia TaxID=2527979 RepID=A0A518HQW2_9BACT|nr:hypothetical protein Enr13x_30840 [Stieleria neptunia]
MHPYEASYLLWRLSGAYAQAFCDHHISYEHFVNHPKQSLGDLGRKLGVNDLDSAESIASIDARSVNRWRSYDDGVWFREREAFVDKLLENCMELPPLVSDFAREVTAGYAATDTRAPIAAERSTQ